VTDALGELAALRLASGDRWGAIAADFQWRLARRVLADDGPRFHFVTRPRGGSKTSDAAGFAAVLLGRLPAGARCYAAAADRDQAGLLLDALRGFVVRNPSLAIEVGATRARSTRTDATIDVSPADSASAYGLLPHLVIIDEVSVWPDTANARALWEALSTALGKVPDCRAIVIGTAGAPASLAGRVREHALGSPLWAVDEVPGPLPWADEAFLDDERARLPESVFERLHMNRWAEPEDRLATLDDVRRCVTHAGALPPREGRRYLVTLDAGLVNDRTAAVVAHAEHLHGDRPSPERVRKVNMRQVYPGSRAIAFDVVRDREPEPGPVTSTRVVVDAIETWEGSRKRPVSLEEVEEWVAATSARYNRAKVIADPWQLAGTAQRLRARGVRVDEHNFNASSNARLASALHVAIRNGTLGLPDDAALIDELASVRMRETAAGTLRLDHGHGQHDDRAVAVGLAVLNLVSRSSGTVRRVPAPAGMR
jgi:phage terminase large subunit-like protein